MGLNMTSCLITGTFGVIGVPSSEEAAEVTVEDGLFLGGCEGCIDPTDTEEGLEKSG